ncbi:replicative helicase loader/inhibitor [Bacillus sp. JJ1764]|uniref:replicative helicase loader/inhibitor n=1 Tax=Bacillus sp. JJ1764 TaxID=3122964 RepID=UPI003000CE9B
MTKEEALKIIHVIESTYPYIITKSETVQFWFQFCEVVDFDQVWTDLVQHIRNSPYPPSISDIFASLGETSGDTRQLISDKKDRGGSWMSEYVFRA